MSQPTDRHLFSASADPRVYVTESTPELVAMSQQPEFKSTVVDGQVRLSGCVSAETARKIAEFDKDPGNSLTYAAEQSLKERHQAFSVQLSATADGHSYVSGISARVPEDQIAQTPAEDLALFLAVTIRKAEELEALHQELLMQGFQYGDVDHRHLNIARNHLDIGLTFLLKALRDVDVLRS